MCLNTAWFNSAKEAHDKGSGRIHNYGISYLQVHHKKFYEAGMHEVTPYDMKYTINPFLYQYDLTMFIWVNFTQILLKEVEILQSQFKHEQAEEMLKSRTLYGRTRSDFLFAAAEFRWPTSVSPNGSMHGKFIRDPWSEKRVAALSDEKLKYVISFGGGGQGKTLVSVAFMLMIFDYFLFTHKGARCMVSTVNKDKLDSASWAYLCGINSATDHGISLTAGRARIAGDHTLMRPDNKDRAGVFKGILIGNQMNNQSIIDKLTGSHGHPFICYALDEMQSTPDPPMIAASNFTMHAKDFRILGSGNYGENNDTLANNIEPDIGWDKVNDQTGEWISTTQNGQKAIVLHFNNNLSPGMSPEGNRKFPHLPSQKILDERYPDPTTRNEKNIAYRRFWIGFRVQEDNEKTVIHDNLVKDNLADTPLEIDRITHTAFAFDSAPAELDRNLMTIIREGICKHTKQRVFGFVDCIPLKKTTESIVYYQESSDEIYQLAKKNNIMSGGGVVDWTGRPAQAELLQQKGFAVHKLIYNKGVPDGVRRDKHTNRVEKAIPIYVQLEFKDDIPPDKTCAHHIAENEISLGAWALRQYILAGRVRGINPSLLERLGSIRKLDDELYHRKFKLKNSANFGSRFHLESKDEFKTTYGFSPDLLDTMFQAAWYMLRVRNLPLTPVAQGDTVTAVEDAWVGESQDHNTLWESDGLYEMEDL